MTNELAVSHHSALASFGDREAVKEIGERLRKMMPGTESFTESEALTVAQIAVAHDLDPFNGEVWGIKGNGKWYGVMVGIKGLRKAARRKMLETNGSYWTEFRLVDAKSYDVSVKGAVAYECILRDTETNNAWAQSVKSLRDAEIPYADVIDMLGKSPSVTGVGIGEPSERSKMGIHARAKKRAEADAIKQRFDVEFQGASYSPEHVDFESSLPKVIEPDEITHPRDASAVLAELGYDIDDEGISEVIEEGEFTDAKEEGADPGWDEEKNSIYFNVADSKGTPYREKELTGLTASFNGLNKKIKRLAEPTDEHALAHQTELHLKRDAVHYWINKKKESK